MQSLVRTPRLSIPYDLFTNRQNAKTYRVRIQPEEDEDPSVVTVRSDFSLADIIYNIERQDCEVLAIRRKGAWHRIS